MSVALTDEVRTADGIPLLRRSWRAAAAPRARALLVHGLGEHLGRYEATGAALAAADVECSGADLRGCGRSSGRRGHVERWTDYHLDLDAVAPPPPFVLIGHSMGGLIALDWALARAAGRGAGPPPQALILSGPLLEPAVRVPAWKRLASGLLDAAAPRLRIPTGIPLADLCSDSAAVAAFAADPLRDDRVTPRWYAEMQRACRRVRAALPTARIPAQFHLAGEERIVSAAAIVAAQAAWGGPSELLRWPAGRHEILQEPFRAAVWKEMTRFALQHAAPETAC